jgi:ABC-2 type transport system permease protein
MNWAQLRGMLWLRWRLTRNQWRRSGQLGAAFTLIFLILALGAAAIGGGIGVVGGAMGLSHATSATNLIVWDVLAVAFVLFWTIGLITELQKSEVLDLGKLLLLPISLRDVFLLNYVSSHLSVSLAMALPAMVGLAIGLVFGRGVEMLLLFPLVFGFFFMISAWTYCLRGWLASLMVNKRRRRAIIMGLTMAFILLAQLPNLISNVWISRRHTNLPHTHEEIQEWQSQQKEKAAREADLFREVHQYVPLLWLPYGAMRLTQGSVWPAVWGAFGMIAIGVWGLAHAYHSTLRFYLRGGTGRAAAKPVGVQTVRMDKRILVERTIPAVPEEAGAMAMASLRSMLRAPEVKMSLGTNVIIFAIIGTSMLLHKTAEIPGMFKPLVASGAAAVAILGLAQLMFNHFGFDRSGFRAIVLLPTPRRHILMGKNLGLLPVGLTVFAIYLGMATFLVHLGLLDILSSILEFAAAFLMMSALGNAASILVPYRIAAGSLRPTKTSITTTVLIFVTQMFFPLAMLPVFFPAGLGVLSDRMGWLPAGPVALVCAGVSAVVAAIVYRQTLEPCGRLLQTRERRILEIVTQEVE